MASWTDTNPVTFNPYIQQQPVEALTMVGIEKQRRYDEGVQRIQSSVDRIAGLDIARDVDKQYLQNKLTDLGDKLKFVAAGDFSDYQLVNAVTGMTSKVGKDENIQNAVISTARYRNEVQRMETDREEGILDPSNEFFFNKQADQWFNNPNVGTSFKGKYIPHFDVFGFAKETFDAVKPDEMSFDQIFELDENGKPVKDENGNLRYSTYMTRLEEKGIFPHKVKQTLAQIFSDPRVSQQLNISGQYEYRGLDEQALGIMLDGQRVNILAGYDEEINRQLLEKGVAKTTEEKEEIQRNIDKLKSQKSQTNQSYISYIQQAKDNPDGVRSYLYKNDVENRYTTMFGHTETSRKIMDSPPYQQMFAEQKEINMNNRWYQDYMQRERFHQDDIAMKQATLEAKDKKDLPEGRQWSPAKIDSDIDRIKFANNRYDRAASNLRSSTDDFIWEMIFSNDETGQYSNRLATLKAREGIDDYGAMGIIIAEEAKKAGESVEEYKTKWMSRAMAKYENMSPEEKNENYIMSRKYENYRASKRDFETEQDNRAMIDSILAEEGVGLEEQLSLLNVQPQTVRVFGKDITLSDSDIYDLATYAAGSSAVLSGMTKEQRNKYKNDAAEAEKRLESRGQKDLVKALKQDISNFFSPSDPASTPYGEIQALKYGFERSGVDWSQVLPVADLMRSKDYSELISKKADIIQRIYSLTPPQATPLLTGDVETDKRYINRVASFAGVYKQSQISNESPDFKDFTVDLGSPQSNNFTIHTSRADGKVKTEIVQYDDKNKRIAGMTITPEQARLLNIDSNNLFESPEIVSLRNRITRRGGKTNAGDPSSKSTYLGIGDYYYSKHDLPKLSDSPSHDAKINIREDGGIFYPYVYMNNGEVDDVFLLQGNPHLENLITALKNGLTPALIDKFLNERYAGESNK